MIALLESDHLDTTNVGDGTEPNVLESDQSDTTNVGDGNEPKVLESDQSDTTNVGDGNEPKDDMTRTTQSKYHPREINRNWGKPPVKPKGAPSISPDQTKWTKVLKRGRRANGRSTSLLNQ